MTSIRRFGAALGASLLAVLLAAGGATAQLTVVPEGFPGGFSAQTNPAQAGGPADAEMAFTLSLDPPMPWPGANLASGQRGGLIRDAVVDLPLGLNGNSEAVPQCPELINAVSCSVNSQVGIIDIRAVSVLASGTQIRNRLALPLYNLAPSFGEVARLGAFSAQIAVQFSVTLNPVDYRVRVEARRISSFFPVVSTALTIWGVPGDPSHDVQRCARLSPAPLSSDFVTVPFCDGASGQPNQQPQPFVGEVRAFFANGTSCGETRTTSISISGWADPDHFETEGTTAQPLTDCDQLHFEPRVAIKADSSAADTPTGLELELNVPATSG